MRFKTDAARREMADAILIHFDNCPPEIAAAGAEWYWRAEQIVNDMVAATGHTRTECAGVIAHLSPRMSWADNVHRAWEMLTTGGTKGLTRSIDNARRAMEGQVTFGKTAWKTASFFANILGDEDRATVDTWAARVAGVPDADLSHEQTYAEVSAAYRLAAEMRGVTPRVMQAITWCAIRGTGA